VSADFNSCWREKLELCIVEVLDIHNVWNVRFLWKKILEVGERCSKVKTFFVMEGVQNSGIALAIVALFFIVVKIS
jgi:hypothetical protein